jgi:hypothetical protein
MACDVHFLTRESVKYFDSILYAGYDDLVLVDGVRLELGMV